MSPVCGILSYLCDRCFEPWCCVESRACFSNSNHLGRPVRCRPSVFLLAWRVRRRHGRVGRRKSGAVVSDLDVWRILENCSVLESGSRLPTASTLRLRQQSGASQRSASCPSLAWRVPDPLHCHESGIWENRPWRPVEQNRTEEKARLQRFQVVSVHVAREIFNCVRSRKRALAFFLPDNLEPLIATAPQCVVC